MSDPTFARLIISAAFGMAACFLLFSKAKNPEEIQKGVILVFCIVTGAVFCWFEIVMTICAIVAGVVTFAFAFPYILRLYFHVAAQTKYEIAVARGGLPAPKPRTRPSIEEKINDIRRIGAERGYPEEAIEEEVERARRQYEDQHRDDGPRRIRAV
jgi:hypothetical protein